MAIALLQTELARRISDMSETQLSVLWMVTKWITEAGKDKETGKLNFEIEVHEGGITKKWAAPRYLEK